MEIQKKQKVHCLQNQVFHIFFGPLGLGETLANFFSTFWEVMGSPRKSRRKKKYIACKTKFFTFFFGPMGLGEALANFFLDVLGSAGKYGNPEERKSTLPAKPKFFTFFWAYGPRGNSREFFLEVLGSDGKSMEINTHKKNQCFLGTVSFLYRGKRQKHHHSSPFLIRCMKFLSENV